MISLLSVRTAIAQSTPYPIPQSTGQISYSEKLIHTKDGLTLHGHLATPIEAHGPLPVVIMFVGSGAGNRYEDVPANVTANHKPSLLFKGIESELASKGFAVFLYDKRGVIPKDVTFLENVVTKTYTESATANNLASDAIQVFDLVKSLPEIDPARIAVLGHSEGTILALKVAEARADVKSLLLLGLFTRSFDEISYYQDVTNSMRVIELIDANQDGLISQDEWQIFHQEDQKSFPDWRSILPVVDATHDGLLSIQEWRYVFEQQHKSFMVAINSDTSPWNRSTPKLWFREYNSEGSHLTRFLKFCAKINVFQGEIDVQTPFEDALELRDQCLMQKTPVASFQSYSGLGHAFSPRIGYKNWIDTIGPMDTKVPTDIGNALKKFF